MGAGARRVGARRATRFVMSIVDITERREAELRLAASERRYRALVEASPSLIWTCDAAGRLTFVSARACRELYGYEPREMIGRHVAEFNAPEFVRREFVRRFVPVLRGRAVFAAEAIHLSRTGERVYVVVSALPVRDESGRIEAVFGICSDITALKARERELNDALRNQQVIFEAAGEGIAFVRDDRIDSANGALAKMLGVTRDRLVGRAVADCLARPEQWQAVRRASLEAAARGEAAIHEAMLRPPAGTGRGAWCQVTARQIGDDPAAMILVLTDVTALKRREEIAWHQANHDELSGLPTAACWSSTLAGCCRWRCGSVGRRRFRCSTSTGSRRSTMSSAMPTATRCCAGSRCAWRACCASTTWSRTGGDEFVVLLPEIEEPAVAVRVAEKLVAAAREDLEAAGRSLRIHASVGVALFPVDGNDFKALLARADAAMYAAKAAGKNRFRFASALDAEHAGARRMRGRTPTSRATRAGSTSPHISRGTREEEPHTPRGEFRAQRPVSERMRAKRLGAVRVRAGGAARTPAHSAPAGWEFRVGRSRNPSGRTADGEPRPARPAAREPTVRAIRTPGTPRPVRAPSQAGAQRRAGRRAGRGRGGIVRDPTPGDCPV
ncbi:MAG: hypothetical protein OHK0044_11940 [Burkholderiaceae bacterium]